MTHEGLSRPPSGQDSRVSDGSHSLLVRREAGVTLVHLSGDLDLAAVDDLEAAFADVPDYEPAVLDMSQVQFMDSSGLAVVLRQSMRRRDAGGSLQLRHTTEPVRRLIEFCCLEHLLLPEERAPGD